MSRKSVSVIEGINLVHDGGNPITTAQLVLAADQQSPVDGTGYFLPGPRINDREESGSEADKVPGKAETGPKVGADGETSRKEADHSYSATVSA
jgi:hypothetical protein